MTVLFRVLHSHKLTQFNDLKVEVKLADFDFYIMMCCYILVGLTV